MSGEGGHAPAGGEDHDEPGTPGDHAPAGGEDHDEPGTPGDHAPAGGEDHDEPGTPGGHAADPASDGPLRCRACLGALSSPAGALARCRACGSAITVVPPAFDTRGYGTDRPRLSGAAAPILSWFDRARLRLLRGVVAPPAVLVDAGAGRGRFVGAARDAGFAATGIEPSPGAVEAARAVYGVELSATGIADAEVAPGSVDAVTLWHVLEHLGDPEGALTTVAGWLRPGGAVLVGVPNLASLQARIGGERWFHLDVPRHRTHFTPAGLRALLDRAGFEIVAERHVLAEHNAFGMWQTLVSRVTRTPSWLFRALQRDAPLRSLDAAITVAALPLAPLAALLELAAGLARRGGTVAVVARLRARG